MIDDWVRHYRLNQRRICAPEILRTLDSPEVRLKIIGVPVY